MSVISLILSSVSAVTVSSGHDPVNVESRPLPPYLPASGSSGPSGTFAQEFDRLIAELGDYLNAAGSELNWMAGAMLDIVGVLLLSILCGLAAFILVAKGFIIATPFIVRAISDNIMMPALSGGLGGGYSFARAAMGSQQAYNRYLIGGASGA